VAETLIKLRGLSESERELAAKEVSPGSIVRIRYLEAAYIVVTREQQQWFADHRIARFTPYDTQRYSVPLIHVSHEGTLRVSGWRDTGLVILMTAVYFNYDCSLSQRSGLRHVQDWLEVLEAYEEREWAGIPPGASLRRLLHRLKRSEE